MLGEQLVQQDRLDLQDLVERQVQVHLVQVALLDQREVQGRQVRLGLQGLLALQVRLALAVHMDLLVLQVQEQQEPV